MLAITALSHGTVPITEMKYIDYTELGTAIFLPISKETPNPLASTDWFTCCANVKTMISDLCPYQGNIPSRPFEKASFSLCYFQLISKGLNCIMPNLDNVKLQK